MGDDAMDPAQAVNVAQKFCADSLMYGVVGPPMSHTAQATLKTYSGCDLVNITTSASKPNLTDQGTKTFFRVNARDDAHGWNCALFISRNLKAKRIAVLNEKTAYCESIADETIKGLKKLGMKENDIMQDTIIAGAKDYSPVLTKVKAFNPDVLFFVTITAPDCAVGVRQAKELGIKAKFFGTEGARDKKDFIKASEGAAEGAYVYHFAPDVFSIPEAANYIKKFEAKYGTISGFGPPAYEAMNILLTAINKAAKADKFNRKEVLKDMAETKNYKGILGFPVTFDKKGDLLGGATYFFRVEGDNFKQIAVMTGK
jgi:branched-chain amino acid transport system substrate-binding protein